jgi:glycosyltransferase involved in cell wall biosynthesis
MKLLVITQAVDTENGALGFFVGWLRELATRFESIEVVCLYEGTHALPPNVRVHSLGKEDGGSRIQYAWRTYEYAWDLRDEYDAVFVHMNQEYVLLAGWLWRLMGKRVYMWRNHYSGSWLTDIAAAFCTKVFCTSKHSYTAKYKKTVLMPVGIDLSRFERANGAQEGAALHTFRSILFLARIAPSKRPEMLIDALGTVLARGVSFTADIVGSPADGDEGYAHSLETRAESLGLHDRVRFLDGVPHEQTPALYAAHDIFVNCSPSGMFDKTLFEAAAAGCRVIAASDDFKDAAGEETYAPDADQLAERLCEALGESSDSRLRRRTQMQALARGESLGTLADRLVAEIQDSGL